MLKVIFHDSLLAAPLVFVSHEHRARWCIFAVCRFRLVLAGCIPTAPISFESFLDTIISTMPPFYRAVHFIRKFFVSTASGIWTVCSVEFAPFSVPHLACVFHFFIPSVCQIGTHFSICGYEVQRTFPLARPPHRSRPIQFINRPPSGFQSRLPSYEFGSVFFLFFLVAGDLALITLCPSVRFLRTSGSGATIYASVLQLCPFRAHEGKWHASFPCFFHDLRVVGHSACNFSPFQHYRRSLSR